MGNNSTKNKIGEFKEITNIVKLGNCEIKKADIDPNCLFMIGYGLDKLSPLLDKKEESIKFETIIEYPELFDMAKDLYNDKLGIFKYGYSSLSKTNANFETACYQAARTSQCVFVYYFPGINLIKKFLIQKERELADRYAKKHAYFENVEASAPEGSTS